MNALIQVAHTNTVDILYTQKTLAIGIFEAETAAVKCAYPLSLSSYSRSYNIVKQIGLL